MRAVLQLKNGLLSIGFILLTTMLLMTSCDEDTDQILEDLETTLIELEGKWSITSETDVKKDAAGTILENINEQYGHNMKTITFSSSGDFLFIDVEEAEWGTGDFTVDQSTSEVELDFDLETSTFSVLNFTTTSVTLEIVEEEIEDGQTVTTTNTLVLTKNSGTEPGLTETALKTKWSMTSNNIYNGAQLITSEVSNDRWMESVSSIDENQYTLTIGTNNTALSIDNYMSGTFSEGTFEFLDESNFVVELENYEDPFLFHITANDGSGNLTVIHFEEMGDDEVKVEQAWTNDFDVTSLNLTSIMGTWEVMAKTEGKEVNGVTAVASGEGPPIGALINFTSNGTGGFGDEQFTFEFVDESNIAITTVGETDYTLIHFSTFNGTNQMSIWNMSSDWEQSTFTQDWLTMDMTKQEY